MIQPDDEIYAYVADGNVTAAVSELKTRDRAQLAEIARVAERLKSLAWQVHDSNLREEETAKRTPGGARA